MAILIEIHKVADDGRIARYSFQFDSDSIRTLVFDRVDEKIWPEDDRLDHMFRAAAGKVIKIWREKGELPETLWYQA